MSWDPVWEDIHASREWGKYPPEELIRFVARNYYDRNPRNAVRFLDLGCGVGSATWYLRREGFSVSALDGSWTAIRRLEKRLHLEDFSADLSVGDAAALPYKDQHFDCVVDLACLMCNNMENTRRIVEEIRRVLKPNGKFFSHTPQAGCWGDGIGEPTGRNTYKDAPEGPFAHMGIVRFCSPDDINDIYGRFFDLTTDYVQRSVDNMKHVLGFWTIAGTKRQG